jgi:hypothetical protein
VYGKPHPERHFRFWRLKFPVLRNKFPVLPKKFPVPFRREFGCKRLNLRADWGVKITDAVITGSLALASLNSYLPKSRSDFSAAEQGLRAIALGRKSLRLAGSSRSPNGSNEQGNQSMRRT